MNNALKVRTQLLMLSGIFMVMLVGIGALGIYEAREASNTIKSLYEDRVVPLRQLKEIADTTSENVVGAAHKVRDGALTSQAGIAEVQQARQTIAKHWKEYTETTLVKRELELVAEMKPKMEAADAAAMKLVGILQSNDKAALAEFAAKDIYAAFEPMLKINDQLVNVQLDVSKSTYEESVASAASNLRSVIGALLAAMVLGGLFALRITRGLTRALGAEPAEVKRVADAVAAGDLGQDITLRQGDTSSVMAAMKTMSATLQQTVASVRQNAEGVASASAQIYAGNTDLSSRTEQQASALEETAASMEEIQTTVKQNADSAALANQMAHSANTAASKGGVIVGEVVTTMKQIDEASRQITEIISVIDGIAFQTNILALNAAVEAARAGEQGRGFAVVATEVRSLAGRSAEAARQIKTLIGANAERVEAGSLQAAQAGQAMTEIVQSIQRVTDLMGEISAASKEQSVGVAQVAEAVVQMDQVTQQNAALVEESAAAAESLKTQAEHLVEAVAVFRLSAGSPVQARSAAPTPAAQAPAFVERRGPNRATNVTRPAFGKVKAPSVPALTPNKDMASKIGKTGTDDWAAF